MQPQAEKMKSYQFGEFEVNVGCGELRRRGVRISLQRQPLAVLLFLLQRPGEIVTRHEIRQHLWASDTFVDFERGINTAVRRLREALCDTADHPKWIETLPRHGYRFIGTLQLSAVKTSSVGAPVVAVLPFVNLSGDQAQEYFVDGVTDEIITCLAKLSGLRVISRTSAFRYKNALRSLPNIGTELGADVILEGSVMRSGDDLRVTAQLIESRSDVHLWAETYRRKTTEILDVQTDVARNIAEQVKVQLTEEERNELSSKRSVNVRAYELYLMGRHWWNKRPLEGAVQKAMNLFTQAAEEDASFALPYVGLADSYNTLAAWESGLLAPNEAYVMSRAAATQALRIDANLAEAHTSLAYAQLHFGWNWSKAEEGFKRALNLKGNYANCRHWYSHLLVVQGKWEESLKESQKIIEMEPFDLILQVHLAWHHFMAGNFPNALEQAERTLAMDAGFHWGHFFRGLALQQMERPEAAIDALRNAVRLSGESTVMISALGHAYASSADRSTARDVLGNLQEKARNRYVSSYEIGLIHVGLGDFDQASECFEHALRERSGWMPYINCEPRLSPYHSYAWFKDIVRRIEVLAM